MFGSFLVAVATSTVLATLINQGIVQWREWVGRREIAKLSAIYAVSALLNYMDECATLRGDKETHYSSQGQAGTDVRSLPELAAYPEDIDWKRLGIDLAEQMFALRIAITSASRNVRERYDYNPPHGGDALVFVYLSSLGLKALELARAIARQHGLTRMPGTQELSNEAFLIESERMRRDEEKRMIEAAAKSLPAIHGDAA